MDDTKNDQEKLFDGYYDGIPKYIRDMSLEELEEAIIKEKQKCDELNKKNKDK